MKRLALILSLAAVAALHAADAGAWGSTGHRLIGQAAMRALPDSLPAFLRAPAAAAEVGELAREPDRWKGGGRTHDRERDTAHFVDLTDDGHVLTADGPHVAALPVLRSEYEQTLTRAGIDVDDAGWLPYALVDAWQQVVRDLAYWRVLTAAEGRETDPARRAWYSEDRARREALLMRDLGVLAHYVGDASQPLHLTIHYNGWGDHPNPDGYTRSRRFHSQVDGYPARRIALAEVEAAMRAPRDCAEPCDILQRVPAYIQEGLAEMEPLYRLERDGALAEESMEGRAFMTARIAAGASELRDLIGLAWAASAGADIGWPAVSVAEVEAGRADPWDAMVGVD